MSKVAERQDAVNEMGLESGPRTAAGEAFSELVVRLFRLNGQTTARWQVLAMVEDASLTVAKIARTLGLARQSVQRVADALEQVGLVTYEDNPRHRRARLVTLTDEGRVTLSTIQAAQRPWADTLGRSVGERELRNAIIVLDRVLEVMTARRPR